jgi:hypothetical protein
MAHREPLDVQNNNILQINRNTQWPSSIVYQGSSHVSVTKINSDIKRMQVHQSQTEHGTPESFVFAPSLGPPEPSSESLPTGMQSDFAGMQSFSQAAGRRLEGATGGLISKTSRKWLSKAGHKASSKAEATDLEKVTERRLTRDCLLVVAVD